MYVMTDKLKTDKWAWVEWVIEERQKKDWSQSDLARKADVTRQTINDYESRRRANPDEQILMRISTALGYPPVYLPRLAGLYPADIEIDEDTEKLVYEIAQLSKQDQEEILSFIRLTSFLFTLDKPSRLGYYQGIQKRR